MPESTPGTTERVNTFWTGDRFLFRHYFAGDEVFARLRSYYDGSQYRFEVPHDEYPEVRRFLRDRGYRLVLVDAVEEFVVVVRRYTRHPENVFKASVLQWSVGEYNCFLLKDRASVELAASQGATPLVDTGIELGEGGLSGHA